MVSGMDLKLHNILWEHFSYSTILRNVWNAVAFLYEDRANKNSLLVLEYHHCEVNHKINAMSNLLIII